MFDGVSLQGWYSAPRLRDDSAPRASDYNKMASASPALWAVEGGAIVGCQDPRAPGWGGYLVSERTFGSFELVLEMNPDWPADTGVMVRSLPDPAVGIQVLVDHRRSGSIGGFYGNGVGGFHGVPFALDTHVLAGGVVDGLMEDDPTSSLEPVTLHKRSLLTRAGNVAEFLRHWRWQDWNELRVRCQGDVPRISTWVNGVFVAEINLATITHPGYDAREIWSMLGDRGHIAFEVHDTDPELGTDRWGVGARCRWRHIRIREL